MPDHVGTYDVAMAQKTDDSTQASAEALAEPLAEAGAEQASRDASSPRKSKRKRAAKKAAPKPPPPEQLAGAIEAMLLAAGDVIRPERLRDLLGLPSVKPVRAALDALATRWAAQGMAVEIEHIAGGVRVVTRPEFAPYVARLKRQGTSSNRLSKSLLETLSIVAYKQPVGRAEVERIRGVQAGEALRSLLERALVKVVGRSDRPGRPLLYGTTQRFLTAYGLNSLDDLPENSDLSRM